jgi:hypothetical protein
MMRTRSRCRGFTSFDAMLSVLPIMLMVIFLLNASLLWATEAEDRMRRQELFDRLVSISDYTVKSGAVRRSGDTRYPNWLDEELLTTGYSEDLRGRAFLAKLYISLEEPDEPYPMCIYRLAVTGDGMSISKLHVCGG